MRSIAQLTSRLAIPLINQQECKVYHDAHRCTPKNKLFTENDSTPVFCWLPTLVPSQPAFRCFSTVLDAVPGMLPQRPCDKCWWPISLLKACKRPCSLLHSTVTHEADRRAFPQQQQGTVDPAHCLSLQCPGPRQNTEPSSLKIV